MQNIFLSVLVVGLVASAESETTLQLGESDHDFAVDDVLGPESSDPDFKTQPWIVALYGGAAVGDGVDEIYEMHVGLGYHPRPQFSINLELISGFATVDDQKGLAGEDSGLIGLDLLLRWHFFRAGDLSFYVDGGAGLMYSDHSLPAAGTHFNFRPQLGIGLSVDLVRPSQLMAGLRWLHISNANRSGVDENPGIDTAFIYAGVLILF